MMVGQSIPSRGVTFACCLRWPLALGVDWLVLRGAGSVVSLALALGPVEVAVTVFWSKP